ncbi:MAG TPA: NUDIX hydrolase [Gemmatimonadales bacterium]|nr:NUDIX hydrolase [Gemmatimonadales bacterium]
MAIPTLKTRRIHSGKFINLDIDTVRFPDGSVGELELVRHPGASAVVPFASDPHGADPTILLIKQYRYATLDALFEIPAGRLNPGEDPRACAERELLEEVGVKAGRVERLTTIWTTPGFTDERIHLFWAADLTTGQHAREADEFIEVTPKPLSEVLALIRSGEICDAKTCLAILFVAGFILEH